MKKTSFASLLVWATALTASMSLTAGRAAAQETADKTCLIKGKIDDLNLRSGKALEWVYLSRVDEYDRAIAVDSCRLAQGAFTFTRSLGDGEPIQIYVLTGFDNGHPAFFLEPGEIHIHIPRAAYPLAARMGGTPQNELYNQYRSLAEKAVQLQFKAVDSLIALRGNRDWLDTPQGLDERRRIGAAALLGCMADRMEFLLDHGDSPLAPLMMEKDLFYQIKEVYADHMLQSVSPDLKDHPYTRSFSNAIKAASLEVGGELPDISLPLADGRTLQLSHFRGKYVLLDFWASWCAPCRREVPYLIQLFEETQDSRDRFAIVSFSLDNKAEDWLPAIGSLKMDKEGWVHASDLLAWGSPAVRMMGVDAVPKTILIDPEGRAISFSLRGDEMVRRVKQILSGDLYYQGESTGKTPLEMMKK